MQRKQCGGLDNLILVRGGEVLEPPKSDFWSPMMLPSLNFGIANLPERTSECFPGNESAPRGTLRESSGARGANVWIIAQSSSKNRGWALYLFVLVGPPAPSPPELLPELPKPQFPFGTLPKPSHTPDPGVGGLYLACGH